MDKRHTARFDKAFPVSVSSEVFGEAKAVARNISAGGMMLDAGGDSNSAAFTGTPTGTRGEQIGGSGTASITGSTANTGDGGSHSNVQPSKGVTIIVKL